MVFTWIFRVEAPANPQGKVRRLAVQIVGASPSMEGEALVARSLAPATQNPSFQMQERPSPRKISTPLRVESSPDILPISRTKPLEKIQPSNLAEMISNTLAPPSAPPKLAQVEINTHGSLPFNFRGELKSRKVISAPPLPKYPDWALSAAVELFVKVSLMVDPNGQPNRVFIDQSSGDSQTDLAVLHYVEKMRFEASLSPSSGVMEWAFLLQH